MEFNQTMQIPTESHQLTLAFFLCLSRRLFALIPHPPIPWHVRTHRCQTGVNIYLTNSLRTAFRRPIPLQPELHWPVYGGIFLMISFRNGSNHRVGLAIIESSWFASIPNSHAKVALLRSILWHRHHYQTNLCAHCDSAFGRVSGMSHRADISEVLQYI